VWPSKATPPPQPGEEFNGFGVAFAIGELAFWLRTIDLRRGPDIDARSGAGDRLISPSLGEVRWPPPRAIASDQALEELSSRLPIGTVRRGLSLSYFPRKK
jgi:hypothetical protein